MPRLNDALRNDVIAAMVAPFAGGTLRVRAGAVPAPNDAPTGTILVAITLPNPAYVPGAAGVQARNGTWEAAATATGTAGYVEIVNAAATRRMYLSGAEVVILDEASSPTTTITAGGLFTVNVATLTQPAQ